jgi:restriction system protein
MAEQELTVWGVHAGKTGDADALFLKRGRVALGWHQMGDLSRIPADRAAFKASVAETYPDKKPGAIPNNAGQLFRFVHEVQIGDLIVYPSKADKQMHIGRVEGAYVYDPKPEPGYPQQRPVKWLSSVPRTYFSQGALYETGSAMAFFQIKNFAEEFRLALETKAPLHAPEDEPETVAHITADIEDNTRDYILKRLAQALKGNPLAVFVADLLRAIGYRTRLGPPGKDGGVDIIAHKDALGLEPPIIKVQVKSGDSKVSEPTVSSLYGKVGDNGYGLFVTLSTFTPDAKTFANSKSNLRLIDGDELVALILQHYEQLNSQHKGILSLKRVYVPEPVGQEEE